MQNIHQLSICARALQLYKTSVSTSSRELIEHPLYTVDLWICMFDNACHSWTEMFLCHSIEISISLERLYQSPPLFPCCKDKSMTYLEMDIICARFLLFLKYSSPSNDCGVFFTHPVYTWEMDEISYSEIEPSGDFLWDIRKKITLTRIYF